MRSLITACFVGMGLVALAACGGDDGGGGGGAAKPAEGGAKPADGGGGGGASKTAYAAADHKGSVSGTVKLGGTAPEPRALPIGGDEFCIGAWSGKTANDEKYAVNADGTLPNVIVWANKGPHTGFSFSAPTDRKFRVSQKDCYYVPHVFSVMVGETFEVSNDDQTKHNVHTKPRRNKEDNIPQDAGRVDSFTYDKAEGKLPFACDIHSWMSAWCFVLKHPFAAVTGADGKFEIKGLPAGTYTFRYWHENFAPNEKENTFEVTITDGAATHDITVGK